MKTIAKIFIFLCVTSFAISKASAQVSVDVSVGIAPPPLPVYVQPPCPVDGYLWQPGYWAYDDPDGYYWVPGVWVSPPDPGYLWTPDYWGYEGGAYGFHPGYWGVSVGFYGGINYGYGYSGWGLAAEDGTETVSDITPQFLMLTVPLLIIPTSTVLLHETRMYVTM